VQPSLQLGQYNTNGFGSAGRGGNDIFCGGATAAPIRVGHLGQSLVIGVGVDGIYHPLFNTKGLMQYPGHGSQAVGGATGIGDNALIGLESRVVHPQHNGVINFVFGRHGQQHASCASIQVRL